MKFSYALLFSILALIALGVFFHLQTPTIADPDGLYHFRHADLYRTNGIFDSSFPWTQYSAIKVLGADLWYGFHLLLIPFTFFANSIFGVRIASLALTILLLLAFAWVLRRHNLAPGWFWAIFFFIGIPNVLFQYLMLRPHVVSLALGLLLVSFLIRGKWWVALLAAFGVTFFHISYFWFAPGIVLAVLGVQSVLKLFAKKDPTTKIAWREGLLALLGSALGALARPHPIAGLHLAYIQVVKLIVEKGRDLPLAFGIELNPLPFGEWFTTTTVFSLLWIAALAYLLWIFATEWEKFRVMNSEHKTLLFASAGISFAFFLMTLFVARRMLVPFGAFGTLFLATAYTVLFSKKIEGVYAAFAGVVLLVGLFPYALYRHNLNATYVGAPADRLQTVAEWLRDATNKGDVVFNAHWDNFAQLFFWNQNNYYVNGMDPIFLYAYDPALYWKFHYLSKDLMSEVTCANYPCTADAQEETYTVLTRDFNAKYMVVQPRRNPNFTRYLARDSRFEAVYGTDNEVVFKIN